MYLKKIWGFVIKPDEYESTRIHWIALYVNGENVTFFDSFGDEHIPNKKLRNL